MKHDARFADWKAAVWEHARARNLTRGFRDVLLTLATFGHSGALYPSHETLAAKAGVCVRTAQDALAQAKRLGLLAWASGALRRTSNRYTLLVPREPAQPGQRLARTAERLARAVAGVARALVGKKRAGGEKTESKSPPSKEARAGQPAGFGQWPAPCAPVRSVAEQLALLASWERERRAGPARLGV